MNKKVASLNINFDSIRECLKLAGVQNIEIRDPAFFEVMDRFLNIADELRAKLTIFVIGSDLLNRENFKQVRKWAELGHEIGNHSFSHYQNLAEMNYSEIFDEVKKSHEIIADCIGKSPKGFISPAWSFSPQLADVLNLLEYKYDTSLFPSFFMPLIQLRLRLKSNIDGHMIPIIRKDIMGSLFGSRKPYFVSSRHPWRNKSRIGKLVMLPLPTTKKRIPIWHTMAFMMKFKRFENYLRDAINATETFYYLIHPADLISPEIDLAFFPNFCPYIERMSIPLKRKMDYLRRSINLWC